MSQTPCRVVIITSWNHLWRSCERLLLALQFLVHSHVWWRRLRSRFPWWGNVVSLGSHVCHICGSIKPHVENVLTVNFSRCIKRAGPWRRAGLTFALQFFFFFVSTFSLVRPVHLYSAEPVESLSDKAVKEWEKDGFGGGGSSNTTTMMKVSPPLAAPDLSYTHNSSLKYPWSTSGGLAASDSDQNGKSDVVLNSWWNCN